MIIQHALQLLFSTKLKQNSHSSSWLELANNLLVLYNNIMKMIILVIIIVVVVSK